MRYTSPLVTDLKSNARRIRLELLALSIRCLKEAKTPSDYEPLPALLEGLAGISRDDHLIGGTCLSEFQRHQGLSNLFNLEPWKLRNHNINRALLGICRNAGRSVSAFNVMFHLLAETVSDHRQQTSKTVRGRISTSPITAKLINEIESSIANMYLRYTNRRDQPFGGMLSHWSSHELEEIRTLVNGLFDEIS